MDGFERFDSFLRRLAVDKKIITKHESITLSLIEIGHKFCRYVNIYGLESIELIWQESAKQEGEQERLRIVDIIREQASADRRKAIGLSSDQGELISNLSIAAKALDEIANLIKSGK